MTIIETVDQDIVAAQKSGEDFKRDALRFLKSSLKNAQIDFGGEITDAQAEAIVAREIKRRRESVESYKLAGKTDLADNETKEIEILKVYLPEQMGEPEIRDRVMAYLKTNPATADKVGQVIGGLAKDFQGKADMALVSKIVREQLGA